MKLDSVIELKTDLKQWLTLQSRDAFVPLQRVFGLGIIPHSESDFKLAVRVQNPDYMNSSMLENIQKKAKGEVDIRYIGPAQKYAKPWQRKRSRPLSIGSSLAHYDITVGTLGCFVTSRLDGSIKILSNNHVLAYENQALPGDAILQPGRFDKGKSPRDVIGKLDHYVALDPQIDNEMDCALCQLDPAIPFDPHTLQGVGQLTGLELIRYQADLMVGKIGRTTGLTHGKVSAFDVDITISYDIGDVHFINQIEIEGDGPKAFSDVGDSGALVFTHDDLKALGLLFAGTDFGGTNGKGLAYANSLAKVLDQLGANLLI